jgi:ribulose-5-phosphate 4-epimerase/fuculose-1-phosphate aldolase
MSVVQPIRRTDDAVRRARVELAAAYRIAALEHLDDGIWNHFSAAVPGQPGHFLLKPHGPLFSEVTASSLIVVDLDGNIVEGDGHWNPTAFYIHGRMHAALPDAHIVFHTHMPHATAVACTQSNRLLPLTQNSMRFHGRVASYNDYGGLALGEEEADRMVAALDGRPILMMANHGVLVTAATIADAVYNLHYLELACRDQILAVQAATGDALRLIPDDVAALTCEQLSRHRLRDAEIHLAAMLRVLDRVNPGYAD